MSSPVPAGGAAERYDVAVIGAGLAGLITAGHLARLGRRVLLADHKRSVTHPVSTTGIFVRRTLEDFTFPPGSLGPPVRQVVLHAPGGRSTTLSSRHDEYRVGRMDVLYRHLLREAISAGVTWLSRAHYLSSRPDGGDSLVTLRRPSGIMRLGARFLVGADGAGSRVAGDLGLDRNSSFIVGVEDVLTGVPLSGAPCFHCFLDPDLGPGYLAWLVHDGIEVHLGVGGHPDRFDPRSALETLRHRVQGIVDLREARLQERRGGRIPVNGVLRRIACAHGLLVGDAAGAVSPLTAGGLDPCYRLSARAAAVTHRFLDRGDSAVLADYTGTGYRRRFLWRRVMRAGWSAMQSRRAIECGFTLLQLPLFHQLAHKVFFGRGSFPDSPASPSLLSGRRLSLRSAR